MKNSSQDDFKRKIYEKLTNLDYGIVGNCTSAALISRFGTIEWLCLPDFDSSSIFAKILDDEKGGEFRIEVPSDYKITQDYIKNTNILKTEYSNGKDAFAVLDFMPRYKEEGTYFLPPDLIRFFKIISGNPIFFVKYDPRLLYGQDTTKTIITDEYIKSFTVSEKYESIYLYSNFNSTKILQNQPIQMITDGFFLISYNQKILSLNLEIINLLYERTKLYWLDWADKTVRFEFYQMYLQRSALILKMLSYQKTGAIIAAITTSLPESIGDERNWDYRFCWIRDSSMIISTLLKLGHYQTALQFLTFLTDIIPWKSKKMQIMYGIRGEKKLEERLLPWLKGYENSKPVRIGNAAYLQLQYDTYGVVMEILHKYFMNFHSNLEFVENLWTVARSLVKAVQKSWKEPDQGIWEFRSTKKHFIFSKMLSWVAMDRGVKMAKLFHKKTLEHMWSETRDEIKADILEHGWNEKLRSFTQFYGSESMDATNLLLADYGLIEYDDPKFIATVLKTKEKLCKNGLMYRYKSKDDFGIPKSSFTVCSFWMIKALYKIGYQKEAKNMFDKLLSYSNHLGIFSEDIDFDTKRLLGNFPQGYSHLALIDTALTLNEYKIEKDETLVKILQRSKPIR